MRVAVVGTSACGKTTFSRAFAEAAGVPHIELDTLYWGSNWTPVPLEDFREAVQRATAGTDWVCDGNYSAIRDAVWARADVLVWLNYSFPVVFFRAVSRTAKRLLTREELFAGNWESWRLAFDPDWIPWWVIRTFHRRRREYRARLRANTFAQLRIIEFRRPREAAAFLRHRAWLDSGSA